jgi:hypothetical protein
MSRVIVIFVSCLLAALIFCRGAAWLAFEQGKARKDLSLLQTASRLDPFVSDYSYEEYRLSGDLTALERAMRLEPTKPAYHMYYGLALMKRQLRTRASDQAAVAEICKGAELKSYSKRYQKICEQFRAAIPVEKGVLSSSNLGMGSPG